MALTAERTFESELVALQRTLYASRNPTRRWLHCTRRDWLFGALRRLAPGGGEAALEVGPGSGVYLPPLASLYRRVVASDVERAYLLQLAPLADRHPNLTLVEDDITRSALEEESFDFVLCTEVLEHLDDSARALAGIRRLLRPGGVLLMSTPQRYSTLELAAKVAFLPGVIDVVRAIYREPVLETGHINLLTAREAERQLANAGFRVEARHKSGVYLPVVAELGGERAARLARWLERRLRGTALDWLLWTQYYVARRAGGDR
jgi:2-polyprenyl-3-methyl-5-hydroxy-6-metoxy-1,4-benzoquinol methylase